MTKLLSLWITAATLLVGSLAFADDQKPGKTGSAERDKTAASQGMSKSDTDITAQIRRSVVKDKTLSTAAHNVTIVTKDGKVTLKGKVNSDQEKSAVTAKAEEVAGKGNVTDELTVTPSKTKS